MFVVGPFQTKISYFLEIYVGKRPIFNKVSCIVLFSGMTRDDLFNTNASIVQNLADACSK